MHISIFLHIFIEKIFIREIMTNKFFSTSGARHAKIWLDNMRGPEGGDMNMKVIDLTHTIRPDMPVYPGTEPPQFLPANSYEKDGFKETKLCMFTHTGTHMDPPAHLYAGRTTLDQFTAEQFIGKALVIDCCGLNEGEPITMAQIMKYGEKSAQADFLLFYLGWDKRWGTDSYFGDYPCLDEQVMQYILAGNYKGIGFDVIGLDPIADENLTRHKQLFKEKEIVNIENLKNLELCGDDLFWFSCFPLKLENCDGSPIRAVAWWEK